jgi:hypothetical protein
LMVEPRVPMPAPNSAIRAPTRGSKPALSMAGTSSLTNARHSACACVQGVYLWEGGCMFVGGECVCVCVCVQGVCL